MVGTESKQTQSTKSSIVNPCSPVSHQGCLWFVFLRKWRSVSDFGIEIKFGWIYIKQGETQLLGRKQTKKNNTTKRTKELKQEYTTEERPAMGIRRLDCISRLYVKQSRNYLLTDFMGDKRILVK